MRDPRRIDEVLLAIGEIWEKDPDLRLGQLIINAVRPAKPCPEVFSIEDRDDTRSMRQKAIGKLLTLDRQFEALLSPLLSMLDIPVEDTEWERLDPAQRRLRTMEACKRVILRESQVQPLLLVFEDLHWIDHETQAFLDSLIDSLPTARVLLLVSYRPEYQHHWGAKTYYTQVLLGNF